MSLSTADAVPYFYAAGVQAMTAVSNYIASKHTKTHFDGLMSESTKFGGRLDNGGYVEKNTKLASLVPRCLAPDAVLRYASRDRDFGSVVISVVLIIAPVLFTSTSSKLDAQVKILALIAILFLLLGIFVLLRKRLSSGGSKRQFVGTYLAVGIAIAINVGAGAYLLFQPAVVPSGVPGVPTTPTP